MKNSIDLHLNKYKKLKFSIIKSISNFSKINVFPIFFFSKIAGNFIIYIIIYNCTYLYSKYNYLDLDKL